MAFRLSYQVGGRLDPPFMPTKTIPFIKGQMMDVMGKIYIASMTYKAPYDMELVSVAVGASVYQVTDNWDLQVGGETVFESIYTKDLPEGAYLMAVMSVPAGTDLIFRFHNEGGMAKSVWVNYQFLR